MIEKLAQQKLIGKFDKKIAAIIKTDLPVLDEIKQFVIDSGGKRIRPLFHYFLAAMNGYKGALWLDTGAIAEIIHAASLLHDDVIDNADVRRGKYTVGKLYGNKTAILAGDYLLTSAIDHLSVMGNLPILNLYNRTIRELTRSELIQMQWEKNPAITMKIYNEIIYGKTASLFGAIAESAGILNSLPEKELKNIRNFGVGIGMLFQIKDDYLDYFLPQNQTGKAQMKDFINGLVTYPMIFLIESLSREEKQVVEKLFQKAQRNASDIKTVHKLLEKYNIRQLVNEKMQKEAALLVNYLSGYPQSNFKSVIMNQIEKLGKDSL